MQYKAREFPGEKQLPNHKQLSTAPKTYDMTWISSVTPYWLHWYLIFIYGNEPLHSNLWTEKNENNTHLSSLFFFPPETVSIAYVQIFTDRTILSFPCYGSSWYSGLSKSPFWSVVPTTPFSSLCKPLQVNDQNRRNQSLISNTNALMFDLTLHRTALHVGKWEPNLPL